MLLWYTHQLSPAEVCFTKITAGTAPNPCPTVAPDVSFPVHLTIENPAVVFADTVDVIEPSELDEPDPPAFQFQATKFSPLALVLVELPTVNPSEIRADIWFVSVSWAELEELDKG